MPWVRTSLVPACLMLLVALAPVAAQSATSADATGAAASESAGPATTDETKLLIPGGTEAGGATATPAAVQAPGVSAWDFIRMLLILAAVVGAIFLLFWLLRRGAGRRIQENELIKVLGSRTLAGNRSLHLVEVGRSVYLVGSAEGGVELIAEVTDQESLDALRLAAAEQPPARGPLGGARRRSFADTLAEIFRPAHRSSSLTDGVTFLKRQRDRLAKLREGGSRPGRGTGGAP